MTEQFIFSPRKAALRSRSFTASFGFMVIGLLFASLTAALAQTNVPSMVLVKGGTLPPSSPLGAVSVQDFYIGKFEVTWKEWREVRDYAVANGYDLENVGRGTASPSIPGPDLDSYPVHTINWYQALKWCNARSEKEGLAPVYKIEGATFKTGEVVPSVDPTANGYRLPTEAEWEWAATGGILSQNFTYAGGNTLSEVGWYWDNSSNGTKAVGLKSANELGLFDMSGNVVEWCQDVIANKRAYRGGCWGNYAPYCTPQFRFTTASPLLSFWDLGLRVVRGAVDTDGDGLSDAWEQGVGRFHIIASNFSWQQADTDAKARGGHLATFTSAQEWSFFKDLSDLQPYRSSESVLPPQIWIGGYEVYAAGAWRLRWSTGEVWTFSNFAPPEPAASETTAIAIHPFPTHPVWGTSQNVYWNDDFDTRTFPYVLEFGFPTDPLKADADGDGFNDKVESDAGSDPNNAASIPPAVDTDGDGVNDYRENKDGTDPNDAASFNSLSKNLVAYYPLNGNANDESGNSRSASIFGAVSTTDREGKSQGAYEFDGIDDCIDAGNSISRYDVLSFSVWFKRLPGQSDPVETLIGKRRSPTGAGANVDFYNNNLGAGLIRGSTQSAVRLSESYSDNRWHHAVVTTDGLSMRLYVDGQLLSSDSFSENPSTSLEPIWIGREFEDEQAPLGGNRAFRGLIDDVRIYGRPLTAAEVASLYQVEVGNSGGSSPTPTSTPTPTPSPWSYTVDALGGATITGYSGEGGSVTIPATIDGRPVKRIGSLIFGWPSTIPVTDLIISEGITNIGYFAFFSCRSLTKVTIPSTVTVIGEMSFRNTSLSEIVIPEGVTSIGNEAFSGCAFDRVTLPDSLRSLGVGAFAGCRNLTRVTIGSGLSQIGAYAFSSCSGLTSVTIPKTVTGIGMRAFSWCQSLSSLYFEGNAPSIIGDAYLVGYNELFTGSNPTVYYLGNSEGWGPTFAGRPTAVWKYPYIKLLGSQLLQIYKGATFTESGATLIDDKDADVSVVASGVVNTQVLGRYILTYSGSDSDGNVAESISRTIDVVLDPAADEDGDGMPNGWETSNGFDPLQSSDAVADADGDGLSNLREFEYATDPRDSDTDGDGLSDGDEATVFGSNPKNADTDGDGMADGWEVANGFDPKQSSDGAQDADADDLSNLQEFQRGTNPKNADTDGDGMADGWEVANGFDPKQSSDGAQDADADDLSNLQEFQRGTNPKNADTDGDGMTDGWEVSNGFDSKQSSDGLQDADADGLSNLQEFQRGTNPKNADTDGDGMTDGWEVSSGFDPKQSSDGAQDADADGLSNLQEFQRGTNPKNADTDGDGLGDGQEVVTYGTDPTKGDTDNDLMTDLWEVSNGFDPKQSSDASQDSDLDGLSNLLEFQLGTAPRNADTDGDGLSDGQEVDNFSTNPNSGDTDGDGLSDGEEINAYETSPLNADTDGDGMPDGWEVSNGFNPLDNADAFLDADGDGLTNLQEFNFGKNPHVVDSLTYAVLEDGTLEITGDLVWNAQHIVVPSSIDGLQVTRIASWAFDSKYSVQSVSLPEGIKSIGDYAFAWSTSLTQVSLPSSLTSIGNGAFQNTAISTLDIPTAVTSIGSYAFASCPNLTSLDWPAGVTTVPDGAFSGSGLTQFTIPATVTSIGSSAFANCRNLTSLAIPNGVTSIGSYAFGGAGLTSIVLPGSIEYIGDNNNWWGGGGWWWGGGWWNSQAVYGLSDCSSLTSITICDGTKGINAGAFANLRYLTNIVIAGSVTSIGDGAFYGAGSYSNWWGGGGSACTLSILPTTDAPYSYINIGNSAFASSAITEATISRNSINFGNSAFSSSSRLTALTVPSTSSVDFGESSFALCYSLTTIGTPAYVYRVGNRAFENSGLTSVVLPGISTIGEYAFSGAVYLSRVEIGSGSSYWGNMVSIGANAFANCASLSEVVFPTNGVPGISVGSFAFANCTSLTNVVFPDRPDGWGSWQWWYGSYPYINTQAFDGCTNLANVTIGSSIYSVSSNAFSNCPNLTTATLSMDYNDGFRDVTSLSNLTVLRGSINYYAFNGCSNLSSVTLADGVTSISGQAFGNCPKLTSITIPASVTYIWENPFQGSTNLVSINIAAGNPNYFDDGGVLYSGTPQSPGAVITYPASKLGKSLNLPPGVNTVSSGAFDSAKYLEEVTFPSSMTSIGYRAFASSSVVGLYFEGDAPWNSWSAFDGILPAATVYCYAASNGFTLPTWNGLPVVVMNNGTTSVRSWLQSAGFDPGTSLTAYPGQRGVPLLQAYAFNMDPHSMQNTQAPRPQMVGQTMSMRFYASSPGVNYVVETSDDLRSWSTNNVTVSPLDDTGHATATMPMNSGRRFMRIKLTGPQ